MPGRFFTPGIGIALAIGATPIDTAAAVHGLLLLPVIAFVATVPPNATAPSATVSPASLVRKRPVAWAAFEAPRPTATAARPAARVPIFAAVDAIFVPAAATPRLTACPAAVLPATLAAVLPATVRPRPMPGAASVEMPPIAAAVNVAFQSPPVLM